MKRIIVDLGKSVGKIRPMHAVNNGPVYKFREDQRITNIDYFREAGIPYARNHDASFCSAYGGEHTVDVHAIFPNFDADPNDEKSYDFACTDEYLRVIDFAGLQAKKNAHIYAWISVPGTNIDYPVLRHPTDDGYYLYHNLNGSSGYPGCIYTENWNSKDCTNGMIKSSTIIRSTNHLKYFSYTSPGLKQIIN